MNFNVENVQSTFDQSAAFNTMRNDRDSQRDTSSTDAIGKGWFGTDVIGLNATKISDMQAAINEMVTNIQSKIGELQTEIDSEQAFKGPEMKTALEQYLTQVVTYCNNLTSNLKAFNDKLSDVKNQWETATGNMSQQVNTTGGKFSTGSSYTETIQ